MPFLRRELRANRFFFLLCGSFVFHGVQFLGGTGGVGLSYCNLSPLPYNLLGLNCRSVRYCGRSGNGYLVLPVCITTD